MELDVGKLNVPHQLGKSQARRNQILDAAYQVFADVGFQRASIELISNTAKVAKPTIYAYFENKQELFLAAMLRAAQNIHIDMIVRVGRALPTVGRARSVEAEFRLRDAELALIDTGLVLVDEVCSDRVTTLRRLLVSQAPYQSELRDVAKVFVGHPCIPTIAGGLEVFHHVGTLKIADFSRAAHHYVGLVLGELPQIRLLDARVTDPESKAIVQSGVRAFLSVYRPPDPDPAAVKAS